MKFCWQFRNRTDILVKLYKQVIINVIQQISALNVTSKQLIREIISIEKVRSIRYFVTS